jgi:1-phosphatidylinositol-5-phosphate 4-kinase
LNFVYLEIFLNSVFILIESPKREIYFIGLVDVLTQFGLRKRTAQAAKTVKHGTTAEISTVHPEQYAKRFFDFIAKAIQ